MTSSNVVSTKSSSRRWTFKKMFVGLCSRCSVSRANLKAGKNFESQAEIIHYVYKLFRIVGGIINLTAILLCAICMFKVFDDLNPEIPSVDRSYYVHEWKNIDSFNCVDDNFKSARLMVTLSTRNRETIIHVAHVDRLGQPSFNRYLCYVPELGTASRALLHYFADGPIFMPFDGGWDYNKIGKYWGDAAEPRRLYMSKAQVSSWNN